MNTETKCKNSDCGKSFKSILQHLNRSQKCRQVYNQEEMTTLHEKSKRKHADREREYKQRNREKVSAYNKDYYGKTTVSAVLRPAGSQYD